MWLYMTRFLVCFVLITQAIQWSISMSIYYRLCDLTGKTRETIYIHEHNAYSSNMFEEHDYSLDTHHDPLSLMYDGHWGFLSLSISLSWETECLELGKAVSLVFAWHEALREGWPTQRHATLRSADFLVAGFQSEQCMTSNHTHIWQVHTSASSSWVLPVFGAEKHEKDWKTAFFCTADLQMFFLQSFIVVRAFLDGSIDGNSTFLLCEKIPKSFHFIKNHGTL